jgi:hypothetical protein
MSSRTVTTITELEKAREEGLDEIIVEGKLAQDLIQARKIAFLGAPAIGALTVAIAGIVAAPATGGISAIGSLVAATPALVGTGLSTVAIISIAALVAGGLTITAIVAIYNEYDIDIDGNNKTIKFYKKS